MHPFKLIQERRTDFYAVFPPPDAPDIFTEIREWKHAQMKRFAATPYSLANMQKMTGSIEEVESLLMEILRGFKENENVNLGNWLHYVSLGLLHKFTSHLSSEYSPEQL